MFLDRVVGIKDSTRKHYKLMLVNATELIGDIAITELTVTRMRAYIQERKLQTSDIQIRHELTALSAVCEWACDNDLLETNVVKQVRRKSLGKAASHSRAIKPADLIKLLTFLEKRSPDFFYPYTLFLLETGMRNGEALNLRWSDIDLNRKMIDLPWDKEKTSRGRSIPITSTALRTLASVRRYPGIDYVWVNPHTLKRRVSPWQSWVRLREEVGLPKVRFHDLRHTFASYTRRMKMASMDRQSIMGHSSEITHAVYAESDERALWEALESVSPSTLLAHERKF